MLVITKGLRSGGERERVRQPRVVGGGGTGRGVENGGNGMVR